MTIFEHFYKAKKYQIFIDITVGNKLAFFHLFYLTLHKRKFYFK